MVRNGGNSCNSWGFRIFFRAPQLLYPTPRPFSRLSVHSRASFTVSFLSQGFVKKHGFRADLVVFRARKRSPRHGKTHFPVQLRFFREGMCPEACSERGVCHPRKVSTGFRGVVPRPLKPTQTTGFGAKTRLGLVQKSSSGGKTRACGWTNFFSVQGTCMNFNRANL